jgi:hypothetical protein
MQRRAAHRDPRAPSRKSTRGLVMMAMPMFTRFAWPPEMPLVNGLPILTSRHDVSASTSSTSSTAAFLLVSDSLMGRFISAVYSSISSTVRMPSSVSNCSTWPVKRRRNARDGFVPLNSSVPVVAPIVLRPAKTSSNVVLPLPEGPICAKNGARVRARCVSAGASEGHAAARAERRTGERSRTSAVTSPGLKKPLTSFSSSACSPATVLLGTAYVRDCSAATKGEGTAAPQRPHSNTGREVCVSARRTGGDAGAWRAYRAAQATGWTRHCRTGRNSGAAGAREHRCAAHAHAREPTPPTAPSRRRGGCASGACASRQPGGVA